MATEIFEKYRGYKPMTISESIIASATTGADQPRTLLECGGSSAEGSLDRPIGRLHAKIVRQSLGSSWSWVTESTTVRELDTFSAEHVASLKQATEQEDAQPMTDLEKAARAIVTRMGFDPDALATNYAMRTVSRNIVIPPEAQFLRPLWTFFTAEAEAALSVLDI